MPIWLRRLRARRRIGVEDRLLELQRQIRGIESENEYLRAQVRRCAAASVASPGDEQDLRMAQLTDDLRRNADYLRTLLAEQLRLRRKLGQAP